MQMPASHGPFTLGLTHTIGGQLVASLRERIVRCELAPGTRLSEQDIATAYGLSRQPVREAFIRLAGEGLLEIRPQRGTFVRRISTDEVEVSRFVREAVEADVARCAAARADDGHVAALQAELDRQAVAVREQDAHAFLRLDERFHRALADAAGTSGIWGHLQPVKMQMDRVRHLTAAEFPLGRLVVEHRKIVEAIARHDMDAAEAAMRRHLRGILDDLPLIVAAQPDFFETGPAFPGPSDLTEGRTT